MSNTVVFPGLGIEVHISRVAFTLFGMPIYWYGLIIACGLMAGMFISYWKARQFGLDPDRMTDVILFGTILSVLCARLYYVVFYPGDYNTIGKILNLRDGGLAIYGGVLGAGFFGWLLCRLRRVPTLAFFDMATMGFLVGQGIGRWGNFTNQEAFGTNTTLPWGMYSAQTESYLRSVSSQLAAQGITVDPTAPVHPTFFYESFWCLLGLVLMLCYCKHRRYDGEMLLMYVAWYGAERCLVEGLRTDSLMWGSLRVSQVLAGVSCVAALIVLYFSRRHAARLRAAGIPTLAYQRVQALEAVRSRYEVARARRDAALIKAENAAAAVSETEKGAAGTLESRPAEEPAEAQDREESKDEG